MHVIMQQSEDGVYVYTSDIENNCCKASSEIKASDLNQTEERSMPTKNPAYTGDVEQARINRNLVDAVMKANKCFQMDKESVPNKTLISGEAFEHVKHVKKNGGLVDTAALFESAKEAVTRFGGIIDRKGHKALTLELMKIIQRQ